MRVVLSVIFVLILTVVTYGQVRQNIYAGFETWPSAGWETHTLGAGNGWIQSWQSPSEAAHNGDKAAYPSINNNLCNNWLVTPAVVAGDDYVVSFWEKFGSTEYYNMSAVYVSRGTSDPAQGDFVAIYETQDPLEEWVNPVLDLSSYAGDTIFIAFRYVGTYHVWFVDDVVVGPAEHINASLTDVVNPAGVSVDPVDENVIVRMLNEGIGNINNVSVDWSVDGVAQETTSFDGLNVRTGETLDLDLGAFAFATENNYVIRAVVSAAGDIDSSNNDVVSDFAVTSIRNLKMTAIRPESYYPDPGEVAVQVVVGNIGENIIDSARVEWYVDDVRQEDATVKDLALMPGQTAVLEIGQAVLDRGLHEIEAVAVVVGDSDILDNRWSSTAAVDTFWESFEGSVFPPEGWRIHFGVRDDINFGTAAHGDHWYTSIVDSNYFGVVKDTIFTPYLEIGDGDHITFNVNRNAFFSANSKFIARNLFTREITTIEELDAPPGNWQAVQVDLSGFQGVHAIGIASESPTYGDLKVDLVSSSAPVYRPANDIAVVSSEIPYLVPEGQMRRAVVTVLNKGSESVEAGAYQIHLVDEEGVVIASLPGSNLGSWQTTDLPVEFTLSTTGVKYLHTVVEFAADDIPANNLSRQVLVNIVPSSTREYNAGSADYLELNFPFTGNGNTNSLGEDDLSQTIYFPEEIGSSGNIYGITYYYDNLLESDYAQKMPIRVWVAASDREDLSAGWQPTSEMILVFDDTVDILPGLGNDLHIPFEVPYAFSGTGNLIVQVHAYDPEWPPSILRMYASQEPPGGPTRSISVVDVFDLDPQNPPSWFNAFSNHAFTRFAVEPLLEISQLSGRVLDLDTMPIANARVEIEELGISVLTNEEGIYAFPGVIQNQYQLLTTAFAYRDQSSIIELSQPLVNLDIYMTLRNTIPVSGQLVALHDPAITLPNVEITATGYAEDYAVSDENGRFFLDGVFEDAEYFLNFGLYGYSDTIIQIGVAMDTLDLGEIMLRQEAISPFDVYAVLQDGETDLIWKDPLKSRKETYQVDLNVCSSSYTNEPDERVWLGNRFEITDTTTITAVAIRTDVFDLFDGIIRIDIFDREGMPLASSDPLTIYNDTVMVIDVPNIVCYDDVYAMVFWENNAESTHALCVDFSEPDIEDAAVIRYPGQDIQLLSEFFGGGVRYAFHVRLLTLEGDDPVTNDDPRVYNVYRGLSSEFPDISNWELLNSEVVSELHFVDDTWSEETSPESYRYLVEAVYAGGVSPGTFSNDVVWDPSTAVMNPEEFDGRFDLFPVPATEYFNVVIDPSEWQDITIAIFDANGRQIDYYTFGKTELVNISRKTSDLATGSYVLVAYVGGKVMTKQLIIAD